MRCLRNWGRDTEMDALAAMAADWDPRFREREGFAGLPYAQQSFGGGDERRADEAKGAGAYCPAMTPANQPHQPQRAYR